MVRLPYALAACMIGLDLILILLISTLFQSSSSIPIFKKESIIEYSWEIVCLHFLNIMIMKPFFIRQFLLNATYSANNGELSVKEAMDHPID